jgi:hypothetical protein
MPRDWKSLLVMQSPPVLSRLYAEETSLEGTSKNAERVASRTDFPNP